MLKPLRILVGVLGLVLATGAYAGFAGNSLRLDYFYPNLATSLDNTTQLVPFSGLTYTCCLSNEFTPSGESLHVSVNDDTITITGDRSIVFSAATFNGLSFFDVFATIDDITNVSLVSSDLPGLDASDLSFDANRVNVNFESANGLNLLTWTVQIHVDFATTVPEPATGALAGLALLALAAARRTRRTRH